MKMKSKSNRRLAVIDTKFPWKLSGFRYWENYQIYKERPDTLFSTEVYTDDFPTKVYDFQLFNKIAKEEGITDIYCVFKFRFEFIRYWLSS